MSFDTFCEHVTPNNTQKRTKLYGKSSEVEQAVLNDLII